jgi:hypothetical protein
MAADPQLGLDDLISAVRLLVRLENDPSLPNATPDRDHPGRQRLTTVVHRLAAAFSAKPTGPRQVLRTVAAELTSPGVLPLRLHLLTYALDWTDLTPDLAAITAATGARPLAAYSAANLLHSRLTASEANWSPESLADPATQLVDDPDLAAGLLAWSLISAAGPRSGWSSAWRGLLIALRNHPSTDVRHLALDLTTASED